MISAERSHLHVAAGTHAGMSGKNNEDRFAVTALRIEGERPLPVVFAIVCDGIGGHRAGEVAAETAVEKITQTVAASDGAQPVETLYLAIKDAGQEIWSQARDDPEKTGMGATCACAFIVDNRLFTAWVGDSRIYLLRGGSIRQLTIDHTWIQEALDAGVLTPEQARGHPNLHVIRRYLGSPQPVEPDMRLRFSAGDSDEQMMANQGMPLEPGDQLLLCSDGLTDLVSMDEIQEILEANEPQAAVDALIRLANQRGGHDNITIVTLVMPPPTPELPIAPSIDGQRRKALRLRRSTCLVGIISLLGLTAALFAGYVVFVNNSLGIFPGAGAASTTLPAQESATLPPPSTDTPGTTPSASASPSATVWVTVAPTTPAPAQPSLTPWPTSTRAP